MRARNTVTNNPVFQIILTMEQTFSTTYFSINFSGRCTFTANDRF